MPDKDLDITTHEAASSGPSERKSIDVNETPVNSGEEQLPATANNSLLNIRKTLFGYVKTKQFWIVLVCGQVLSLCITGTNTLSQLLAINGVSIPAFQLLFNYVTLAFIWVPIFLYREGLKSFFKMLYQHGWKYVILSFFDVMGNYFTLLGFRYTNLLSAQLINFWAIVVVVILSFLFLHVRYRPFAIAGIFVCVGGMGLLLASDKIRHTNDYTAPNALKGDLFCLLGATAYGFSNTSQEYLVSKRPLYEVIAMVGFIGIFIDGVIVAIWERHTIADAAWSAKIGGWVAAFDLLLVLFYSLCPIIFRMGSAAFLNISLLTGNFWSAVIAIYVFHISIHWLYPIAFVCIVLGLTVYFLFDSPLGDSAKPWLGEQQELGVDGIGTARRRVEHDAVV